MSLRQKTISGLSWSFVETFSRLGITFGVGLVLARLLTPTEFGLIGMLTLFIAVSQTFVDSGFSQALIRKTDCTDVDYSTVFYYNLCVSAVLYALLFVFSGHIAAFFKEPVLQPLVKVLGLVLLINALGIIQRTQLIQRIDFKTQTRISIVAALASGTLAVVMAFRGYGVWSLVAQQVCMFSITTLLLWKYNKWLPIMAFSKRSFNTLFAFGSRLLASGLLDTTYKNIYLLVIGRFFSAADLGYYTRADQFKQLPSLTLSDIVGRVTYPVLSSIQHDLPRLKRSFQQLIKSTMLLTFVMMMGLAAVAEPLIITLIGEKWRPSVEYLQLLCFAGMMYPLHALNLNILKVTGRSDLFLRLEIIKKALAVPVILLGIFYGIRIMIFGMILNGFVAYFLNSYWSGKLVQYPWREQLKDISPSFFVALGTGALTVAVGWLLPFAEPFKLTIQIISGALFAFSVCEATKMDAYLSLKEIVLSKIKEFNDARK